MKEVILNYMKEMLEMSPEDSAELFGVYMDTLNEHCDGLAAAIKAADYAEIRRLTHSLTGCSGNIGAEDVVEIVREINAAAKAANQTAAENGLRRLIAVRDALAAE
ncbi:MAG: Hpt domain-containing protein [Victivallaceae bacterium]|nr:Hpt domain-containing protein [Victivallaceae bacterium]